jgi:very-short-patch-repair endonuclease
VGCLVGSRTSDEIDGYYHFGDLDAYRRDRRKDLLLQTQGFVVIRVLAEDVMRDARPAVNAVCQALAYRSKP